MSIADIFRRLLTPLWLRPERALWDAHELCTVGRVLGLIQSPSMEYGCTEGTNTFVMLGGEFDLSFDEYDESSLVPGTGTTLASDYFDVHSDKKRVGIKKFADQKFDIGVSWRESHIVKSARLGLYEALSCVEIGAPLPMIASDSIRTLWSPNLYWNEGDAFLRLLQEHKRVLHDEGQIITILPDEAQRRCQFFPHLSQHPFDSIAPSIDRGIHANTTRHAQSYAEWKEFFGSQGLKIEHHEMFLPSLVSQVYQIGFRPMFPVFKQMYDALLKHDISKLLDLKQHWIDTVLHFMLPLCDVEWMKKHGMEYTWHTFVLRKRV
jgi:hypothetical protein